MSQETRVLEIGPLEATHLEESLKERLPPDAQWRPVPHALFSVKSLGVVLTCYRSGKLVLQGEALDVYEQRFLGNLAPPKPAGVLESITTAIGSDEAGKGDYFGPLSVAAVRVTDSDLPALRELGVTDSKALSDTRVRTLAGAIEQSLDHEVIALAPPDYNRLYAETGNLNYLLADLHTQVLAPLARRHEGEEMIVDRFAREELLLGKLRAEMGAALPRVTQVPRAEQHPAVAAASILARTAFLDGLAACEADCGTDLHKGAGAPVDVAGRRVLSIGGMELLGQVAKLHFKNTGKLEQ